VQWRLSSRIKVWQLSLAKRRAYIDEEVFIKLYTRIETLAKKIQALINSLKD
jgi:hypothetical protein